MSDAPALKLVSISLLVRRARVLTLVIAGACAIYLGFRFDLVTLPDSGCTPVSRYAPGSRLLVDRWADGWRAGDFVFVEDAAGGVHLGLLEAAAEPGFWFARSDSRDCPSLYPDAEMPFERDRLLGRVVLGVAR